MGIDNWPPATSPPITSAYSIYRRHHQSEPKRRRRRNRGVFIFIFIKATFLFYSILANSIWDEYFVCYPFEDLRVLVVCPINIASSPAEQVLYEVITTPLTKLQFV